jgi:hypothetical protein
LGSVRCAAIAPCRLARWSRSAPRAPEVGLQSRWYRQHRTPHPPDPPEPDEPRVSPCPNQVKVQFHLVHRRADLHDQLKPSAGSELSQARTGADASPAYPRKRPAQLREASPARELASLNVRRTRCDVLRPIGQARTPGQMTVDVIQRARHAARAASRSSPCFHRHPYWVRGAPRSASRFLSQIMMVRSPK